MSEEKINGILSILSNLSFEKESKHKLFRERGIEVSYASKLKNLGGSDFIYPVKLHRSANTETIICKTYNIFI